MRRVRPRILAAALPLLAVGVAGCRDEPPPYGDRADVLEFIASLDHVAAVQSRDYPDDYEDYGYPFITLEPSLSDEQVRGLVDRIKIELGDSEFSGTIEIDIDGFVGSFYSSELTDIDHDLERALWLRADGRALSYRNGADVSVSRVVTAPAGVVAQLALDYDAAVPITNDGRRSHRVESPDRSMAIEWTNADGLGMRLDRDAVEALADLQTEFPGTTGWFTPYDRVRGRAAIYFSPDDIELEEIVDGLDDLIEADLFERVEIGWGPARAAAGEFATAFGSGTRRDLVEALAPDAGVREVRFYSDNFASVVVTNGDALHDAVATLRRLSMQGDVELIRDTSPYLGQLGHPILSMDGMDSAPAVGFYAAVADVEGVLGAFVPNEILLDDGWTANLQVSRDIDDGELSQAVAAFAELPEQFDRLQIFAGDADPLGPVDSVALGTLARDGFQARGDLAGDDVRLAERVQTTWAQLVDE